MIYLDTAALVKLVRREPETDSLVSWLNDASSELVSSVLVEIELPRALRRTEPHLTSAVPALLERVSRYEIDHVVRSTAADFTVPELRLLDAIHLATAQAIYGNRLHTFVTYDKLLRGAAETLGIEVASPGADPPDPR